MAAPTVQVTLDFLPTSALGNYFVLDDATKGKLDGATYKLAPSTVTVDVTTWANAVSGRRGRSRETDQFSAGTCNVVLRNEDRRFDPTNTAGPYYPGIAPRSRLQVKVAGNPIFTGRVDDYDLNYQKPANATVSVSAVDSMALLSTVNVQGFEVVADLMGGPLVSEVLNDLLARPEVAFPDVTDIGVQDNFPMQSQTWANANALDTMKTYAASDAGFLFVSAAGVLTYRGPTYLGTQVAAFPTGQIRFSDAGGATYGYTDIGLTSALQLLYNRVQGKRNDSSDPLFAGAVLQQSDDATSQAQYGVRQLSLPGVECWSDDDVAALCDWYLGRYKQPEPRFDTVAVNLSGLSPSDQAVMTALDMLTIAQVVRNPPGGGTAITQLGAVESMAWTLDVSASSYKLTLGLMNTAHY